jgi:hypothetical protein
MKSETKIGMKNILKQINAVDIISIAFRVLAVMLVLHSGVSQSSAVSYMIWDMIFGIVAYETYTTYKINKTFIFIIFSIILYTTIVIWMVLTGSGEIIFSRINVTMLFISLLGLLIRSYVRKNYSNATMILIAVQLCSGTIGTIVYCVAIIHHPQNYNIFIVCNWICIIAAYVLVTYNGIKHGERAPTIIFNMYGIVVAILYGGFILHYSIGWF